MLDSEHGQRIIAMVCGPPPEGRARWTVRLIAEEAVKRPFRTWVSATTASVSSITTDNAQNSSGSGHS
jgi:hypothetical protein